MTLAELQCVMDENGATDLVIDLIVAEPNHSVFLESLRLGIAMLEGGNGVVQVRTLVLKNISLFVSRSFPQNLPVRSIHFYSNPTFLFVSQ